METESSSINPEIVVRWPFRAFAALVVLAGFIAAAVMLADWSQEPVLLKWQFLAGLPVASWLIRIAWYAVIRGRSPVPEYWPFASQRVFACYVALWLAVSFA
jgi:hypothetical protein